MHIKTYIKFTLTHAFKILSWLKIKHQTKKKEIYLTTAAATTTKIVTT